MTRNVANRLSPEFRQCRRLLRDLSPNRFALDHRAQDNPPHGRQPGSTLPWIVSLLVVQLALIAAVCGGAELVRRPRSAG